jgi:hypothetical protein
MPLDGLRLLLVGIGLLVPSATWAQQYTVIDLGTLGSCGNGAAINSNGQVVAPPNYEHSSVLKLIEWALTYGSIPKERFPMVLGVLSIATIRATRA